MAKRQLAPDLARAIQLLQQGQDDQARSICRRVLKKDRRDLDAYQVLGLIEAQVGRPDRAIEWFRKGLKIAPNSAMLRTALASALITQGAYRRAIDALKRVLKHDPDCLPAALTLAEALEREGQFDEARAAIAPWIDRGDADAPTICVHATLEQRAGHHDAALTALEPFRAAEDTAPATRQRMDYIAGKSLDILGRHDDAFAAFRRANETRPGQFDADRQDTTFAEIARAFSADRVAEIPRSSRQTDQPLFVVSMPRSGSTLVEQILCAHTGVEGAGEIDALLRTTRAMHRDATAGHQYPDAVFDLDRHRADHLAKVYLDRVHELVPGADRIVDKHLQNFRLLGLVQSILPNARVIWCRRDPMAVCFSCYMMPLVPEALPYSTRLRDLGRYHIAYERLMRHWMDVLELPILEVQYEELVANQEPESRRIIEFAGLEWQDDCLRFHESGRKVSTASYDQVRQPIYTAALQRYAHYEAHLGPLREALDRSGRDSGFPRCDCSH